MGSVALSSCKMVRYTEVMNMGPAIAAPTASQAVNDPALAVGRFLQILDAALDDLLGHNDTGVAGRPDCLHLGDGHGAFVEVAAVHRRHVPPSAAVGLRLARV